MNINRLSDFRRSSLGKRVLTAVIGVIANVVPAFLMQTMGFPLFLDTIGTVAVSAVAGFFPGILTAVVTNAICMFFNVNAIYFGFMNALVAMFTAWFVRKISFKTFGRILSFITIISLFTGSISACINWYLLDGAQTAKNSETIALFSSTLRISMFWAFFIYSILLNYIDKGFAVIVSWLLLIFIPEKAIQEIEKGNWRQRPLPPEEIETLKAWGKDMRHTMRFKTALIIIVSSILLVIVTGWSGISLYFSSTKEEKTVDALNSLKLVSKLVDADVLKTYVTYGSSEQGYEETEKIINTVLDSYDSVESIYIVSFGPTEGRIIFEVGAVKDTFNNQRKIMEYDGRILSNLPDLLQGNNISPLEHGDQKSWKRSVFSPIKDDAGNLVCYAIADVSITYMADYMKRFIVRSFLILMGFFVLVLANALWYTNALLVYPIRSMAKCVDDFSSMGYEQEQMDKNVKSIRALDIKTEDEVEKLYQSICRMTLNLSEQMRDLRRLSEATAKMQDGLIITMADMVENRDADTGEHIQKTALYVKIIVEGLKKKGYYAEKITPKFMSDVVRSAPLHDIGKIHIPDEILNKPGKLTPEEYEIMKTHASAGKKIMENAISTVEGENYLKEARNMAAYHHERWDGNGYPEGLHGEVIPLSARIMAVADVFDALTSPRIYKPAFPLDKALSIITEESGKMFDPKCVEVFLDSLPEVKVILKKYNKEV